MTTMSNRTHTRASSDGHPMPHPETIRAHRQSQAELYELFQRLRAQAAHSRQPTYTGKQALQAPRGAYSHAQEYHNPLNPDR